jgi:hypothetical protein
MELLDPQIKVVTLIKAGFQPVEFLRRLHLTNTAQLDMVAPMPNGEAHCGQAVEKT